MNTALRCTTSAAVGNGLVTIIKNLRRTTSGAAGNGRAQQPSNYDAQRADLAGHHKQVPARRRRHWSWNCDQVPAALNERCRGQRPVHHDQVPAQRRGHRPGHHIQVPATRSECRREQRPGLHDQVPREPKRGRGKQLGQGPHKQKLGTNSDESPQPSRHVRRKGAAPLSGADEQTARAISAQRSAPAYFLCKWGV